jgi:NAD(P)-dependent dehydrogenase (short-subunit alcohol dehydrogenase family)
MTTLQGRTSLITGATRGIGLAMALRAARAGAGAAIAAKTAGTHGMADFSRCGRDPSAEIQAALFPSR